MNDKIQYFIDNPVNEDIDTWLLEYGNDLSLITRQIAKAGSIKSENLSELIIDGFYFT